MHTQKVAITIPKELVTMIDDISKKKGLSRSKFISTVLRETLMLQRNRHIKDAYDLVLTDDDKGWIPPETFSRQIEVEV